MTQPYVDCAIELSRRGIKVEDIDTMVCDVGEGTVHRLWEPLADKQQPPTAYSAKFSSPYCVAVGFIEHAAGLPQFSEEKTRDPEILSLASKVSYVVDPDNPYPSRFTGHIRATLKDGSVQEVRRENMRGGAHDPLPREELEAKFVGNVLYGGFDRATADRLKAASATAFSAPDLSRFPGFTAA